MIKIQPISPRWRFLVNRIESQIAKDYVERHDEDANGILERSEFQGSRDVFERIDQNKDNRLELSEVTRYVDLLKQYEPKRSLEAKRRQVQPQKGPSFSVSSYERLTGSIRDFFSGEISNLDQNGNGFLERDELGSTQEEFSKIDQDQDGLISSREWAEGFVENDIEIQMVLKAYRFSHGMFQNTGGIIQMTV